MSQYTTTSTETLKSEDTITEEDSISNDNRSSTAQSSVEDYLEILNAPTSQTTTSSNQSIEFEVSIVVSPIDYVKSPGFESSSGNNFVAGQKIPKPNGRNRKLPPLAFNPSSTMLEPEAPRQRKSRSRSRSRNRTDQPAAHNRFHHNCCDVKKSPSIDDIKAQSMLNAKLAKGQRERIEQRKITTHHATIPTSTIKTNGSKKSSSTSSNAIINGGGGGGGGTVAVPPDTTIRKRMRGAILLPLVVAPFVIATNTLIKKYKVLPTPVEPKRIKPPKNIIEVLPVEPKQIKPPKSGGSTRGSVGSVSGGTKQQQVSAYLASHPDFLENYVMNNVDMETMERWTIRKARQFNNKGNGAKGRKPSLSKWKFCVHADKRAMLREMTSHIRDSSSSRSQILNELATCIKGAIDADGFNLYIVSEMHKDFYKYVHPNKMSEEELPSPQYQSFGIGTTMAAYVGQTKDTLRAKTSTKNSNFPNGINGDTEDADYHVLLFPFISSSTGELEAIFEFIRTENDSSFHEEDEEIVNSYMVWGEVAIYYADLYGKVGRQKDLSGFLLSIVRSIFMEMVSMDSLIIKIMNFAQTLVSADRASLFLVDAKTNQMYARIFDIKDKESSEAGPADENIKDFTKEIRFPVGTGIAGYVAETGETLNVHDAYNDPRFNATIDEQTGYTTNSILCMPICIRGQVIGVVQMINKIDGGFTTEDEEAFEMFAIYCGLALHHAKLYDKIRRSEQKYRVALEVLSYHNASSHNEVAQILEDGEPPKDEGISKFTFYALNMDDMTKVKKALYMFIDLFGLERFDYEVLVRFLITVKRNYRTVAYHNWTHGFHVANSIYSIVKSSPGVFKPLECLSMFIGAICHDLDHRGFNNKFMIDIGSPLAAIYSTSTMEHHHFNMAVIILQQESHNIFAKLNPDEYRQVLGNMKHCILATDLALFFPNKARLSNILKEEAFSWELPDHRLLVEALAMTGSDLCASSKPWDLQMQTVTTIYEEFYMQGDSEMMAGRTPLPIMDRSFEDQQALHQGDVEKDLGWKPIPLFDRDHAREVASMQLGFIGGICLPCYDLLVQVLPNTSPMQKQCVANLDTWKGKAEMRKKEQEEEKAKLEEESSEEESSEEEDDSEEEEGESDDKEDENAENQEQDEKQNEEEADDDGIEDKETEEVESAKDTKVNCKSTLCDHDENKDTLNCKSTLCDHANAADEDKETEVESAKDAVNCKSTLCDHGEEEVENMEEGGEEVVNCKSTLCDHGEEGGEVQIEVTEAEVEEQVIEDDTVLNCQSTLCNHDEEKIADNAAEEDTVPMEEGSVEENVESKDVE